MRIQFKTILPSNHERIHKVSQIFMTDNGTGTNENFEAMMVRLEEIVKIMESDEVTLEKSIELFEEGMELSQICREKLNNAEKRIEKIMEKIESSM